MPESQEHHGQGFGHDLPMSGTITAVGPVSITIQTSSATKTYKVTQTSDIDKNGEAAATDLVVGDTVTFSLTGANGDLIDKLHAGDESKDRPQPPAGNQTADGSPGTASTSGASYSA